MYALGSRYVRRPWHQPLGALIGIDLVGISNENQEIYDENIEWLIRLP